MTAVPTARSSPPTLASALERLAARPGCLLALLLALNALARPYANFSHDARLYSAQVLNRVDPGCYADDLFFRYGSQDAFSIFSRLAAPLTAGCGIEATFFGLFLLCNALFVFALQRFVLALVPERATAVLALAFMMVAGLSFSGLHVLQVQEPFLTPRALANALVLFGLERLLHERYGTALAFIALALPVHPLMAFGGLLVCVTYLAFAWLPTRIVTGLLAAAVLLGVAIVLDEPLGTALFGTMDTEWRDMVRAATIFNFPLEWSAWDWLNLGVSFAVLVGAVGALRSLAPAARRLAVALIVVGAAGFAGTLVGSIWPYALLFQGQPARVLWLLKVTQVAFGFALIAHGWSASALLPRLTALGLAVFFCVTNFLGIEFMLLTVAFPFCCLAYRGVEAKPRYADWPWRAAAMSLALGVVLWAAFKWTVLVAFRDRFPFIEPFDFAQKLNANLGPALYVLGFSAAVCWLGRRRWLTRPALAVGCVLLALGWHGLFFAIATVPSYRAAFTEYGADVAAVRDYLAHHPTRRGTPTVYCALGAVNYAWIDWHAQSYFDWAQSVGVIFNRQTALEARRRAQVVRAFELAQLRESQEFLPDFVKTQARLLYQADLDCPEPSVQDLRRLCAEPGLDFLVLRQDFPGLAAQPAGQLFIYDCRQVRAALNLPEPDSAGVVAARADPHAGRALP